MKKMNLSNAFVFLETLRIDLFHHTEVAAIGDMDRALCYIQADTD